MLVGGTAVAVAGGAHEIEDESRAHRLRGPSRRRDARRRVTLRGTGHADGAAIAGWPRSTDRPPACCCSPTRSRSRSPTSCDAVNARPPRAPVIGGLASAGRSPGGNRLVLDDGVVDEGAVGVFVDGGASRSGRSCRRAAGPIGRPFTVTRAERNLVARARRATGDRAPPGARRRGRGARTASSCAAACTSGSSSTSTRPSSAGATSSSATCSAPTESSGALAVGEQVEVGQTVQFQVRDAAAADEDLRALLTGVDARRRAAVHVQRARPPPLRRPRPRRRLVEDLLGPCPLAGAFCAGEIGPVGGRNFLHGFTASLAFFALTSTWGTPTRRGCRHTLTSEDGGMTAEPVAQMAGGIPRSSSSARSTSSAASRWTRCRRRTPAIPARRWRSRRSRTCCTRASCGTTRADADWPDRDRFVLSAGHASMLLYSMLYLTGFGLELDDLREFRQWGSRDGRSPRDAATRPASRSRPARSVRASPTASASAIAEQHLRERFGAEVCDHHVFAICSDGDLEEGVSHEAASLAGHLGLGRLVYVYDDNHISIDGRPSSRTATTCRSASRRYGWHVVQLGEVAEDLDALERGLRDGIAVEDRPDACSCCGATSVTRRRSTPTPRTRTGTRSAPTRSPRSRRSSACRRRTSAFPTTCSTSTARRAAGPRCTRRVARTRTRVPASATANGRGVRRVSRRPRPSRAGSRSSRPGTPASSSRPARRARRCSTRSSTSFPA